MVLFGISNHVGIQFRQLVSAANTVSAQILPCRTQQEQRVIVLWVNRSKHAVVYIKLSLQRLFQRYIAAAPRLIGAVFPGGLQMLHNLLHIAHRIILHRHRGEQVVVGSKGFYLNLTIVNLLTAGKGLLPLFEHLLEYL